MCTTPPQSPQGKKSNPASPISMNSQDSSPQSATDAAIPSKRRQAAAIQPSTFPVYNITLRSGSQQRILLGWDIPEGQFKTWTSMTEIGLGTPLLSSPPDAVCEEALRRIATQKAMSFNCVSRSVLEELVSAKAVQKTTIVHWESTRDHLERFLADGGSQWANNALPTREDLINGLATDRRA